jgi:cytochrome c peroxidase
VALALEGAGCFSVDAWLARNRVHADRLAVARRARWSPLAWGGAVVLVVLGLALGLRLGPGRPDTLAAQEALAAAESDPSLSRLPIPPLPASLPHDPLRARIGRKLFHDTRLSGDGSLSCVSCHDMARGGADGRRVSEGTGGHAGELNTPTVLNAALNFRQFWDGRAESLEDQVSGPLENPREMNGSWERVVQVLREDPEYASLFRRAFPDGITAPNVQRAIADFERTLLTPDSPFDRYLRGEASALDHVAQRGHERFTSLGCISCHQGANVGGNIFQTMGKVEDYFAGREIRPADLGRFNVTGDPRDKHKFKVPSLRNVARTAPYFHDGSARTLREAVEVMARYQLGTTLTEQETLEIVAFLESLNGELPEG